MSYAVVRLNIDGTRVGCALLDAPLRRVLADYGYDWRDYNRFRWPIGASRWATGTVILTGNDLDAALDAGAASDSFSVELGTNSAYITLAGMYALPPVPLFVANGNAANALYALPIVCGRYHARTRAADENFNLLQRDRATWQPNTTAGASTPYTYDEVLAALAADAGLPWAVLSGSAVTTRNPTDVRAFGESAATWIDSLLAESGRVYVYQIDGTARAELINARTVFTVLTSLSAYVKTGGVRYAFDGSPPSNLVGNTAPVVDWMSQTVPATVRVVRPSVRPSSVQAFNDPWVSASAATYNAASASLQSGDESVRDIADNQFVLNPSSPTSAENARREAVATDFYRRYRAGGMDVFVGGIVAPTFGGSCQEAEWWCDPVGGFHTRLRADPEWVGYGFLPIRRGVRAGDAMQFSGRHDGTGEIRPLGEVRIVRGTITHQQTSVEAAASSHAYKALSLDGIWNVSTFAAPKLRPFNGAPLIEPAEVGSECSIWIDDTAGVPVPRLWACQERLVFEECGGAQFVYGDDDTDNAGFFLVSPLGDILVSEGGDIITSAEDSATDNPEDLILTGADYGIVFDEPGNAMIGEDADSLFVSAGHFDDIMASAAYATITTAGDAVAVTANPETDPEVPE